MGLEDSPSLFRPNLISPDLLINRHKTNAEEKDSSKGAPGEQQEEPIEIILVEMPETGVLNHKKHVLNPEEPKPLS